MAWLELGGVFRPVAVSFRVDAVCGALCGLVGCGVAGIYLAVGRSTRVETTLQEVRNHLGAGTVYLAA